LLRQVRWSFYFSLLFYCCATLDLR
jgi:hypothetical protein